MKKFLLIIIMFLFCTCVFSQEKPRFKSMNSAGVAVGESHPQLLVQSVNGVKYNDWFAGLGVGLDEYEIKSLPLFLDIRMDFGDEKKGFIYGDFGYNFFLEDKQEKFTGRNTSWKGGVYSDVGVGFRTIFIKKVNMIFSLGHSYKNIKKTEVSKICGFIPQCYEDISREKYHFGRLNLKVGWEF